MRSQVENSRITTLVHTERDFLNIISVSDFWRTSRNSTQTRTKAAFLDHVKSGEIGMILFDRRHFRSLQFLASILK